MSLRDQILDVMKGVPGPVSTAEINAALAETATPKSISMALTKLARSADIVRVAYGSYKLAAATDPAAAWVPRHPRALASAAPEAAVASDEPATGQQRGYVILSVEERAKGFVRPVREVYLHRVCGTTTRMARSIAETYARDPSFYGGTFCASCQNHFSLREFVWDGTDEQVGS